MTFFSWLVCSGIYKINSMQNSWNKAILFFELKYILARLFYYLVNWTYRKNIIQLKKYWIHIFKINLRNSKKSYTIKENLMQCQTIFYNNKNIQILILWIAKYIFCKALCNVKHLLQCKNILLIKYSKLCKLYNTSIYRKHRFQF